MTESFEEDYYAILGIDDNAPPEDIRKAYLKLAKKLHPDRFPNDEQGKAAAQTEFRLVTQAHYVLGDTERKAEYDRLRQIAKMRNAIKTGEATGGVPVGDGGANATDAASAGSAENINMKWAAKHLGRADDLFRKRRYQEAETAIKEAIRLVPNDPKYHNKLAEIYLARGWKTYAMTEVQASLRIDPKDPEAKNLETKIKATSRDSATTSSKAIKKGFLDQIKEILNKKI
jgi:curved DNA-binding protein CbpA